MANGKKSAGQFQPGQSGNPKGRPKTDYRSLEARGETRQTIISAMCEVMNMPHSELHYLYDRDAEPYTSGAKAMMASILQNAITDGCPKRAQFFMSYLFGRPVEYDPKDDEKAPSYKKGLEAVPSSAIMKALDELSRKEEIIPEVN